LSYQLLFRHSTKVEMAVGFLVAALLSSASVLAHADAATPISKVLQLLTDLERKVIGEGEAAQKVYLELTEFCEDRSKDLSFQITTAKGEKADLEAVIAEETALIGSLEEKIGELASDLTVDKRDLKAATAIRKNEQNTFNGEEKQLMTTVDMLQRAVGILEKHASLVQLKNAGSVAQALGALVQASALSTADATQLTALVQNSQDSSDGDSDSDPGAPDPSDYEGHSGDIVSTISGLLEKAEEQLSSIRKTETENTHNFELMKQALEDEIKVGTKDMADSKKARANSEEKKAAAEGDLAQTEKLIKTDSEALADLHSDCMTKAQDYEAETQSRGEELKALNEARKVVATSTGGAGGAADQTYGLNQVSFVQTELASRMMSSASSKAVHFVRDLAEKHGSSALAQLAMRMASVMSSRSRSGEDPFVKVKGLISDMIEKLEDDAGADAEHKAYCDKELGETHAKREDKEEEIEKLTTSIEGMSARSAQLKSEVAALQKALLQLASAQLEMDQLREEEKDAFVKNKADMEQGLSGIKLALKVLREYYGKEDKAHDSADGAGAGIMGLLEVVESDFTKGLAEMIATEEASATSYDKETKENQIEKTTKDQDVKYKTQESTDLDKKTAEASSDRDGTQTELNAVMEYLAGLEKQCIEKAETYGERKGRFEAEIAGLKQALEILSGEAVLLQQSRSSVKRSLRAVRQH